MLGSLLSGIKRLRGRSSRELLTRAQQSAWSLSERVALQVGSAKQATPSAEEAHAVASQFFASPFFPGFSSIAATIESLRSVSPDDEHEILVRAQAAQRGEVAIFGHGLVDVGNPPRWTRDPISGVTAPVGHWSTIPYLDAAIAGDHKVIWEINRHQYFITLGQAWQYSRDEQWPQLFATHIRSWMAHNPATFGMNWASSLEVSYRAIAWIWALRLFEGAPGVDDALTAEIVGSLEQHGRHLSRHLSTYFSPNTHLTGEALGLFYIGLQCPTLQNAARWALSGAEVLEQSLQRQLLPDGVYFEQATQYHRYTVEIYLHYLLLTRAHGRTASPLVAPSLQRLYDVLLNIARPDGTIPLIGDDDGGRLLPVDVRPPDDVRSLLAVGAVVLQRSDLAWSGQGDDAMLCWMLGAGAPATRDTLKGSAPAHRAKVFASGGIYVMRDGWSTPDGHMVIDAGPFGALSYGHSHADALAVDLSVGGVPLFVDAGTYTYMGPERNAFRETASHNAVEIDAQSACVPGTAFRWNDTVDARANSWIEGDTFTFFAGEHRAYQRLVSPATHYRSVLHPSRGAWLVRDDVQTDGEHALALRWRCAPGLEATLEGQAGKAKVVAISTGERALATLALIGSDAATVAVESGLVSQQFARKEGVRVCIMREQTIGNASMVSVVIDKRLYDIAPDPIISDASTPSVLGFADLSVVERGNPELQHHVFVGRNETIEILNEFLIDAKLAWVTTHRSDNTVHAITAVGVRHLDLAGKEVLRGVTHTGWVEATTSMSAGTRVWSIKSGQHAEMP